MENGAMIAANLFLTILLLVVLVVLTLAAGSKPRRRVDQKDSRVKEDLKKIKDQINGDS